MTTHKKTIIKEEEMDGRDTPGVIAYRVEQLEQAVKDSVKAHQDSADKLSKQMTELTTGFVPRAELMGWRKESEIVHVQIKADIDDLKDWNKWAVRIVLGVVIIAVIGLVVSNQFVGVHL